MKKGLFVFIVLVCIPIYAWGDCLSDFDCGIGYRCVKAPYSTHGVCMKSVNEFGMQQYDLPRLKGFFFYLAQIKAPKEIRNRLKLKGEKELKKEEEIVRGPMPKAFLDVLRKDTATKQPEFFDNAGIPYKLIRKVLDGEAWLRREEVIKLANLMKRDVNEYLIKAEYIPEEFENVLGRKSVVELMRALKKLPPESMDKMINAIETILKTAIKEDDSTGS